MCGVIEVNVHDDHLRFGLVEKKRGSRVDSAEMPEPLQKISYEHLKDKKI